MDPGLLLLELGLVIIGLALLARVAGSVGVSAVPLYLLAGLTFGEGGLVPLVTTQEFIEIGAQIGLILLLLTIGLEYSAAELISNMRQSAAAARANLLLNYTPGFVAGLVLGWGVEGALFLGGVTLVTSSGIMVKTLTDLGRLASRETPLVLSLSVTEDLAMAFYLPLLTALVLGEGWLVGVASGTVAVAAVAVILMLALRLEIGISRLVFSRHDEALLLTILGIAVLVAGAAELLQFSAAAGALLVGIVLSGPAADQARPLVEPLRDFFAAVFFVFFGLGVDPGTIPGVLLVALLLALVTGATKFATGWWGGRLAGLKARARARAGAALIPRGEFSIAIGSLGVAAGVHTQIGSLTATYVFVLAVVSAVVARVVEVQTRRGSRQANGDVRRDPESGGPR